MVGEFGFRGTSELEEIGAEPDLLYVSLMIALSYDLFDCVTLLALFVLAEPD